MAASQVYLAIDLGASSGRLVAGKWDGERLELEEVERFENGGVAVGGRLYWDILSLWQHILVGLRKAAAQFGDQVVSVGVDTWGVDFALLGRNNELLANPYHYRDGHTVDILELAFQKVERKEIFRQTGLQFMPFNTLYQLLAMKRDNSPILEAADSFLMIPDLIHWMLTGVKSNEYTNATTTQFFDPQTGQWANDLLEQFGLPTHILGEISPPGTRLGQTTDALARSSGLGSVDVVLPGTHDTASAVMSVPVDSADAEDGGWAYISSGTWSLLGMEVDAPIVNQECQSLNFTNEGGVGNTIRLLKNIAGLWLVQECRRIWERQGANWDWDELVKMAAEAAPLVSLIQPDDPRFVAPADMPDAIRQFCRETGQPVPESAGAVIRCVLESLALRYRMVLSWAERLAGVRARTLHIVGGGSQNKLLCQMAADACNRRVVAGPVEATSIGNIMMQAVSSSAMASISEARRLVGASFGATEYLPRNSAQWDEASGRFEDLLNAEES